jgi:hypothetical protein
MAARADLCVISFLGPLELPAPNTARPAVLWHPLHGQRRALLCDGGRPSERISGAGVLVSRILPNFAVPWDYRCS